MKITRKTFLKLGGASLLGAGLGKVARFLPEGIAPLDEAMDRPVNRDLRINWVDSFCTMCPIGCALKIKKVGDRASGIRPDKNDLVSKGALCLKAYAQIQDIYSSQRLLTPRRALDKKNIQGSWKEGLAVVGSYFLGQGGKTAVLGGSFHDLDETLWRAFAKRSGARYYSQIWAAGDLPVDAFRQMTGYGSCKLHFKDTESILAFGADWLSSHSDPSLATRLYSESHRSGHRRKMMTTISSRYGLTSLKSDQWFACKPGMEGMVALAAAGLYLKNNKPKVQAGVELKGLNQFKDYCLKKHTPEKLAQTAGVSMESLQKIVKVMVEHQKTLIFGRRSSLEEQGAVIALAALTGGLGTSFGLTPACPSPFDQWLKEGSKPQGGDAGQDTLLEDIEKKRVDTVLLLSTDPVGLSTQPQRWKKALATVRVFSIAAFKNESNQFSEWILPPALGPERARVQLGARGARLIPAAVRTPEKVRSPLKIALQLASLVGKAFDWPDEAETLRQALTVKAVSQKKGPPLKVDLGKIVRFATSGPSFTLGQYHLLTYSIPAFSHGYGAHLPHLRSTAGFVTRVWWKPSLEMNPKDMKKQGFTEGQMVNLQSTKGRIRAYVTSFEGMAPGSVSMALGPRPGDSSWKGINWKDANPLDLIEYRRQAGSNVALYDFQKISISAV